MPSSCSALTLAACLAISGATPPTPVASSAPAANGTPVTFSITNLTDFHGHLEQGKPEQDGSFAAGTDMGAALLASLVRKVNEGQDYILTSAGDNVGGSAFVSAILDDMPTLEVLNQMGVQVSAVGNHEFDRGVDDLHSRIVPAQRFEMLGANVVRDGAVDLPEYAVKEVNGVRVAFIGSVTQLTAVKVSPDGLRGVRFADPVAVTNEVADRITAANEADIVVALMHEDTASYAQGFNSNVDIAFGGDSHVLDNRLIERPGASPLVVMQAGKYGQHLADVDVTWDPVTKTITRVQPALYSMADAAGLSPDPQIADIVAQAQAKAQEAGGKVIASIADSYYRGANPGEAPGSNRGVESQGNSMIAEATRWAVEKGTGQTIDIGIMNAGGVRQDLDKGEVTYQEAFNVQPFGNDLIYGTLTGRDILDLLEQQWQEARAGEHARLALGFSEGFTYAYDPARPAGQRVIAASLHGQPLDPARGYRVAASSFLFSGGDAFLAFTRATDTVNVGIMDIAAFTDYLARPEGPSYPSDQAAVGMSVDAAPEAGKPLRVRLSSLAYTVAPRVTTVELQLREQRVSGAVDTTVIAPGLGETGTADLTIDIPADAQPSDSVTLTTDAGTAMKVTLGQLGMR